MPSETGRPIPYIDEVAIAFPDLKIVCGHIGILSFFCLSLLLHANDGDDDDDEYRISLDRGDVCGGVEA